ncbi:hypothetical protein PG991_000515 [Apiospora marii]|uniref:Uncharacterized protein n=1 Tax=Apiospora marii TaxID=335849 RepID=A0ABR1T2A8_9PEZI
MDRAQFNCVTSVLRDLTLGKRPRVDDLPTLLNLHQGRFVEADGNRVTVYFHPNIIHVPSAEQQRSGNSQPVVVEILRQAKQDLRRKWFILRQTYRDMTEQQDPPDGVEYGACRFLFFIHSHRIDTNRFPFQNTVYTVSIWDRELKWDELIWHDVYPDGRNDRREAIHWFWTQATTNFLPAHLYAAPMGRNTTDPNRPGSIRYRTVYHTWEQPPQLPPPPRDTVMFVLATAMFHMNEATDQDQVVMPKTWGHVTGHRAELIPRLVFCGLAMCLESEHGPDGTPESQRRFLREFGVAKRLEWLRAGLRFHIHRAGWPAQHSDALRL